tara:strand:+ start:25201 stop:26643 length:1443 start_codon:yes stop_codon:yes gene_type:complete
MDITQEKSDVFGQIAALRVSTEGFPITSISNSIPSITQATNSLNFLTDLVKALTGFEALKESLVDILTHNLDEIELDIKQALKKSLKSMVSCSVNPSIPDFFINDGITLELDKIDYLDMFKIDPTTSEGALLYNDVNQGLNSTDFNTYLYNVIQGGGATSPWGLQTTNHDILEIKFDEQGSNGEPNNSLSIKPSSYYANNKKLPDLNNDYIDSIQLFNSAKLINNIIESIFGVVSVQTDKDSEQIKNEIRIEDIVNRIINTDDEIIIDDSYYTFSNEQLSSIDYRAELRRNGMRVVTTCGNAPSTLSFDTLSSLNAQLDVLEAQPTTPQLMEEISIVVREGLDNLADESAEGVGNQDRLTIKLSFIEEMLKQLMTAIVNVILSPKLAVILAVNHAIIYGEAFTDTEDFMKKNSVLLTSVLNTIRDAVVVILMAVVLKEIKKLVTDNIQKTQIEKTKYKKAQVASLVGVPTDILRQLSGLV